MEALFLCQTPKYILLVLVLKKFTELNVQSGSSGVFSLTLQKCSWTFLWSITSFNLRRKITTRLNVASAVVISLSGLANMLST